MPPPRTAGHKGCCQPAWMTCQMVAAAEKRPLGRRHLSTPLPLQESSVPTLKSCPKEPSAENEALTCEWKACGPRWALAGPLLCFSNKNWTLCQDTFSSQAVYFIIITQHATGLSWRRKPERFGWGDPKAAGTSESSYSDHRNHNKAENQISDFSFILNKQQQQKL